MKNSILEHLREAREILEIKKAIQRKTIIVDKKIDNGYVLKKKRKIN